MRVKILVRPVIFGILASLFLLMVYFVIMSLGEGSIGFAISELKRFEFAFTALILGFGIQVGLFTYVRDSKVASGLENSAAATGGVTSTVAMIACCAHHVTDILPLIGLTIAATFLVKYQLWFLGLGIISNLVGISLMIRQIMRIKHE